ncbi:hypothetical protein HPB50_011298 [Hyalomma asiaticum]|uniref:Uncharacterized protein n=1 Tax=Hyalomma asiaticum TaxID=266040 RepID=A0ACB7SQ26_HYAAI|nr:hypothetical protein HPB50_011298 [Hyalomma asiaticum]
MDFQVSSHQDSSIETESVAVAERRDCRSWTEDGWQTVLSRRQKKSQVKEQRTASQVADCNNPSSSQPKQGSQVKHERRPRRHRPLPFLPREDIKVVLRPHKGLVVNDLLGKSRAVRPEDAIRADSAPTETRQRNYARGQDPGRERLEETEHHLHLESTTNSRSNSSCSSRRNRHSS